VKRGKDLKFQILDFLAELGGFDAAVFRGGVGIITEIVQLLCQGSICQRQGITAEKPGYAVLGFEEGQDAGEIGLNVFAAEMQIQ
jgi:hypothetical protein